MTRLFAVLSDEHRLGLIERLRREPSLSVSELAAGLEITRQAVTKHLDRLHAAGLIRIEWRGRERLHSLDATPLRQIEEWLQPFSAAWDERLARLRAHLEDRESKSKEN